MKAIAEKHSFNFEGALYHRPSGTGMPQILGINGNASFSQNLWKTAGKWSFEQA